MMGESLKGSCIPSQIPVVPLVCKTHSKLRLINIKPKPNAAILDGTSTILDKVVKLLHLCMLLNNFYMYFSEISIIFRVFIENNPLKFL